MRRYGRLGRKRDIALVRARGCKTASSLVALYALPVGAGEDRVAITVSKAVGPAVVRNLLRRRIFGALDGLQRSGPPADLLFIVRPTAATAPYSRLAEDLGNLVVQARRTVR